ncbi:MAG: DNA-binding protein [Bacteroidales bacterium]|jgi:predicted histone-like DNA-binding protein|nr:DNA-binding protein [Bacteroidales bacterium]
MAIQIKSVERGQPGVAGGGVKKYYATPVHGKEITLDGLTKAIEKTSTVNGADIRAVLYAMVEEAVLGLSEGRIIRLGDLGSLRITLSSEGKETPEAVTGSAVKKAGVIFTPGSKLQEMLKVAKFTK